METFSILLLLTISILLSTKVSCQYSIGIKGGYTTAWQEYGDVDLPEDAQINIQSFNAAFVLAYEINRYFGIDLEPGIVRRGAACIPGFVGFEGDTDLLLTYANLPLFMRFQFPLLSGQIKPFSRLGFGTSYLVKAQDRQEINIVEPPTRRVVLTDITHNGSIRTFDSGLYTGLGIIIDTRINQFRLAADGFLALEDSVITNMSRNRNINFTATILWRL